MNKANKPAKPIRLASQTKEEQEMQISRFLANKKENYFQLILANILQTGLNSTNVIGCIDAALNGADYILTKLYPVEKKED